jgi:fructokinase
MEKENKKHQVAGLGEILWDLLPHGKQMGGAPANFAYHAQMLGTQGHIISAIGDDALGAEIIEQITAIHLSAESINIDQQHPTGTVSVKVDSSGNPDFIINTDVAWDYIPLNDRLLNLGKSLDAVCFGSLAQRSPVARQTIQALVKSTRENCLRIFDLNLRQHFFSEEIIYYSLQIANCLKLNEDEFLFLAKLLGFIGSEEKIINKFFKRFELRLIALTKGEQGSSIYTTDSHSFQKSTVVRVVDTVGAGDAFTAGMCIGILKNFTLKKFHENAARLAAYVCTQKGATPVVPKQLIAEITNP